MPHANTEEGREKRRASSLKWAAAHREEIRAHGRAARLAWTPEQHAKDQEKSRRFYIAHREENLTRIKKSRAADRPKWNAYSVNSRKRKREKLAGRPRPELCEICGRPPIGKWKVLHFDHDHETGAFRGWICHKCNTALGLADDDPKILLKLVEYLKRSHALREA